MITDLVASGFDPVTTAAAVGDHIQILAQYDINPQQPPGGEKFIGLAGWVKWGVILASVMALLFAAGKFGYEKYFAHGEVQSPKQVVGALVGGVVGSIAGVLMQAMWG